MPSLFAGTVDSFDDVVGRGWIIADESNDVGDRFHFHRASLRDCTAVLQPRDRVLFRLEEGPRGAQAVDIHHELETQEAPESAESVTGTISKVVEARGFGFIRVYDGREAFFHVSSVVNSEIMPQVGTSVTCELVETEKGLQARNVVVASQDQTIQAPDATIFAGTSSGRLVSAARGRIVSNPRYDRGFAFIEGPDQCQVFFHVSQLVDPSHLPSEGEQVVFRLVASEKGPQARDVAIVADDSSAFGTIAKQPHYDRGFGFIDLIDGRSVFFHVTHLIDPTAQPEAGTLVSCKLAETPKGLNATHIAVLRSPSSASGAQNLLAAAILARDNRRLDEAARLYERGMAETPSVQLVLSFAAMEKNRDRKTKAMKIYEEGIRLFPRIAKLREDAGVLAASLGQYREAIKFFEESLSLCRTTNQAGETGVLLGLARTYMRTGTLGDLKHAISRYEEAQRVAPRRSIPKPDHLALQIARIRTQHHRGDLAVQFLGRAGFHILRAELHDQKTSGADFVVRVDNAELTESYGIGGTFLVRCMFQGSVTHHDLESLDKKVSELGASGLLDDQVALLVVSSLSHDLERTLYRRIEERRQGIPAIVPLPQSAIEALHESLPTLRRVLDQWMYRRDLFALNSPVVGRKFFGRGKPLAEVREAIASGVPLGVFGLRKVGKTSLLKETERRLSDSGDVVAYIDLLRVPADVVNTRWLYWKIANQLRERSKTIVGSGIRWRLAGQFADFLDVPKEFAVATAFDADMTSLLNGVSATRVNPHPKVVLLLDEVERLLPTRQGKPGFDGFFDFFSYFRGLCQETNEFVFVITGANAAVAEAAQFESRDNPVFNFFKEVYLQLLSQDECALMIKSLGRGMGLRFADNACCLIHTLTGGHPFFSRQLCSFLATRYSERPLLISEDLVRSAVDDYLNFTGKDFKEIIDRLARDYPDERDICIALAKTNEGLSVAEIPEKNTVRHLVGYQIAQVSEQRLRLTMDLMRLWLKREYIV